MHATELRWFKQAKLARQTRYSNFKIHVGLIHVGLTVCNVDDVVDDDDDVDDAGFATRQCMSDGSWFVHPKLNKTWTNYTACTNPTPRRPSLFEVSKNINHTHTHTHTHTHKWPWQYIYIYIVITAVVKPSYSSHGVAA